MNLIVRFLLLRLQPWHRRLQMAVDILMIDLELMLGLSIYNLASDDQNNQTMQQTVFFKLVGWLDIDSALKSLNDSTWVWILLFLVSLALASTNLLLVVSLRRHKTMKSFESDKTRMVRVSTGYLLQTKEIFW